MNEVVHYDEACRALARAKTLDDFRDIADKFKAVELLAKRVKNRAVELDAGEGRHRAERKCGELLISLRAEGCLTEGRPHKTEMVKGNDHFRIVLEKIGFSRNDSSKCQKYAEVPTDQFNRMIDDWRRRSLSGDDVVPFDIVNISKADRRARRERELSGKICALPEKRYGLIVADPEWRFQVWSRDTGMDRAADNHYPTSELCDIKARDVASIAADDCALGLWSTVPMLVCALEVMAAWDFEYKTHWVWGKDRIGPGFWNRNKHEVFLFGTRGHVPCPAQGQQWDSLLEAPRKGHSEKPEVFLEMMESYFPSVPKIELNRIGPARPGWTAWGYEAVQEAAHA